MEFWIVAIAFVFVLCIFTVGILIPNILRISFRKKLLDVPDERKVHTGMVPRLGGVAFKPAILFSMAMVLGISELLGYGQMLEELRVNVRLLAFGYCAIDLLYLVGMADDLIEVRYRVKFVAQILCGVMLIAGGLWIDDLHGLLGVGSVPEWVGYPLTLLLTVFIINSINLIDGIDGLASGLSSIVMLVYGLALFLMERYILAMLAFSSIGVLVPFFYYNVFGDARRGRKIFMGDTGSLTIGVIISMLAIYLGMCVEDDSCARLGDYNRMAVVFSPLLIPCFDVIRVFVHRIRNGKNPFKPDKTHIHHKLLAAGFPQRWAMITIIGLALLFALGNIALSEYVGVNLLLVMDAVAYTLVNLWLSRRIKRLGGRIG